MLAGLLIALVATLGWSSSAGAQVVPPPPAPPSPGGPGGLDDAGADDPATFTLELSDVTEAPSQGVIVILALSVLAVAPALLIMLTSFTRIAIVLSLTRNALGLHNVPPNQVIAGLALFLTFFVMGPTLSEMNEEAFQPLLRGEIDEREAYDAAIGPIREFMMRQVGAGELELFIAASGGERPADPEDVSMAALIPAFVLSELKTAFIIGFVIFVPFLVIDIVVASSLMSLGMMMLPPVMVSLPFKLLLFVMVDGWGLVVRSLLTSFS
jgi:flagellar biosynthetic protein FliP